MDESIVKVCFDEDDPDVVRVGGSNGSIACVQNSYLLVSVGPLVES